MPDAFRSLLLLLTLALAFLSTLDGPAIGAEEAARTSPHPVVPGFERFHSDPVADPDPVAGGLLLLGELNCTSCHAASQAVNPQVLRKQAPILDKVGSRVRPAYLRAFLSDPQAVKPGTTMPHVLAALPEAEKAETVEALVHFLATTGSVVDHAPARKAIPNGKKLYHQIGCVACHGRRDQPGARLSASMPLGSLSSKYTMASLSAFLQDPHKVRPSGRMPALNLVKNEAVELASYLLEDLKFDQRPNLSYRYYEGTWQTLPDFDELTPRATGKASSFDLSVAKRPDHMALRFEGYFQAPGAGEYTFHLTSDDGSKLFIDDALVVDNDGIHAPGTRSGTVELIKGMHKLVVGVFNAGSGAELDLEYERKNVARQSALGAISLTADEPENMAENEARDRPGDAGGTRLVIDQALVTKGRDVFERVGCASCHSLKPGRGPAVVSTLTAATLEKLTLDRDKDADKGCLAEKPKHANGGPRYGLDARQREALAAVLRAIADGPLAAQGPSQVVTRTLTAFNCYACHVRDGKGGVEEARQEFFATTQKEMGDEGRIPPSLDGVGAKLQDTYLKRYLDVGVKDRPYMLTRMPRFGVGNVGDLIPSFAALDPLEAVEVPPFTDSPRRVKSVGRFLSGGEALGCIKCHNFKGIESEGVQAVDMTVLTRRLRHDWFHRYLVDTQAYRPGTRMPTGWPNGKTMLPQVLGGDTRQQIESIWQFLSDGPDAAEPYGLGRDPLPLVPETEVILYRNFVKGAGTRAIGAGYPERVSLAFDANDLRLALVWQGSFIDASRHWSGRGVGFQPPLGDNVLTMPPGPTFAFLSNSDELWPRATAKERGDAFRGYRLSRDGRPTFLYDLGTGLHVADAPEPVTGANPKATTLKRTLTLTPGGTPPGRDLWLRAAAGATIDALGDGWYRIDGEWKMRITADADLEPILRKSEEKTELLVPVKHAGERVIQIVQEFLW